MRVMANVRVWALVVPVLLSTGCIAGLASVQGSGNIVTLEPGLSGFSEVSAGSGARVRLLPGRDHSVVVRIDDNLQEDIRVEVDGSTLEIGMRPMISVRNRHFEVDVTMPDLDGVSVSGGARAVLSGFDVDHRVDVSTSGGARVEGELSAAHLSVTASGGARSELTGDADTVTVRGSGGSRTDLSAFEAGSVEVSLSGGSRAEVVATSALTGGVSGGGSLTYGGQPATVDVGRSGGGRVNPR